MSNDDQQGDTEVHPVVYTAPDSRGASTHDTHDPDSDREAMVAAASAYDRVKRTEQQLRAKLDNLTLDLQAKNNTILQLEHQLAEERNRVSSYQAERDQAIADRAHMEAFHTNILGLMHHLVAQLTKFELPAPVKRSRRPRNHVDHSAIATIGPNEVRGESGSSQVPDGGGGPEQIPG